ncbi:uncharacterized protein K444DRAFT_238332 [Hyaloscypha bicolor E]|uniref:Uncharacterized protein n=1 Tax=Hyaloscypha bicolor E TaxID=1095630 RepID=A0A2J6SLT2_9HELO|nr:uncharacterized protein K444DRAFT_238332 [Hyaloscypha bicolor E]PMD51729.1 hypothetical protein K444DRAFT_238332 [Hyaloscypha bicolor E]
MLPRPAACCPAVKRHLFQPSDSIWVSDEVLRHAFQRFVNSRSGKRYGSFVPGPLESRRRLGKRRMAHLTESAPAPAHNTGPLWGFFGDVGNAQWQWEAPTTRKSTGASTAALPAWLLEWNTSPEVVPESAVVEGSMNKPTKEAVAIEEDIVKFRTTLLAASSDQLHDICEEFNQLYKQSLRLGLVSGITMHRALNTISRDIRLAFSDSGLGDTQRLLSFYQAFWDGVLSCKVLQPVDLDARLLNRFLSYLGNLPSCTEVQTLFHDVMHAASVTQLGKMNRGVDRLVEAWARSWLHEQPPGDPRLSFLGASRDLSESLDRLDRLQSLMHSREDDDRQDLSTIQKAVEEAKVILDSALEHIVQAEKALVPRNGSIETLANILGYLPQDHLYRVLASCTQNIVRIHNSMENPVTDLYYGWLSLVAKVPKLPHQMFVNIVKRMGKCKGVREQPLPGAVVLSRWISQGYLGKGGALIRNTFEVSSLNSGPLGLGLVLSAIDKHREKVFRQTKGIFKLLHNLERYREVFGILAQIQDLGLKLPRDIIGPTIEIMSKYDLQLAYRIQKMFYTGLRTNKQVLRPDLNSNFIVSMVNHRRFSPQQIWKAMGVPFYEKMQPSKRSAFSTRRLSPAMIELVMKVAIAFAQTDARCQRVAFRNVVQCLHHLRRHNAPLTPELTRAISHAGFTRKIVAGEWISKELLDWVLGLIEVAEGTDVAVITDKAVTYWNEQLAEEQEEEARRKAREMNVLRVGPID